MYFLINLSVPNDVLSRGYAEKRVFGSLFISKDPSSTLRGYTFLQDWSAIECDCTTDGILALAAPLEVKAFTTNPWRDDEVKAIGTMPRKRGFKITAKIISQEPMRIRKNETAHDPLARSGLKECLTYSRRIVHRSKCMGSFSGTRCCAKLHL